MMAVLNKENVPPPVVPKETVTVPELGGDVIVRGLLLTDRIRFFQKGQSGKLGVSSMLAFTVIDAKGEEIFTEEEWEAFGAKNFSAAIELFEKAKKLSGMDVVVNKKK
jgi:hypothetical protein